MLERRIGIPRTVHCLDYGQALCGMQGLPGDWPDGHVWLPKLNWPKGDAELRKLDGAGTQDVLCGQCDDEVRNAD